jgi:hypothetical protein
MRSGNKVSRDAFDFRLPLQKRLTGVSSKGLEATLSRRLAQD